MNDGRSQRRSRGDNTGKSESLLGGPSEATSQGAACPSTTPEFPFTPRRYVTIACICKWKCQRGRTARSMASRAKSLTVGNFAPFLSTVEKGDSRAILHENLA